jgi:large subunit ribosomal protein L12
MEMVYAALLLHSTGKKVDETGVKKILDAAGAKAEAAQVKALVASLEGVDIEEAIKQTAVAATAAPAASAPAESEAKKEEKKDEGKKQEEAAAGLSSLFG